MIMEDLKETEVPPVRLKCKHCGTTAPYKEGSFKVMEKTTGRWYVAVCVSCTRKSWHECAVVHGGISRCKL